jgi:hypothetical protein
MFLLKWIAWGVVVIITSPLLFLVYCIGVIRQNGHNLSCNGFQVYSNLSEYQDEQGRRVVLIPMSHVASPRFYDTVSAIVADSTLALTEGVNDRTGVLTEHKFSYEKLASIVGLSAQAPFKSGNIANADGDLCDLNENTINTLKAVFTALNNDSFIKGVFQIDTSEFGDTSELLKDISDGRNETVELCLQSLLYDDSKYIIDKLNIDKTVIKEDENEQELLQKEFESMFDTLERFKNIAPDEQIITLPWGARHIEYFQNMLEEMNFTEVERIYPKKIHLYSLHKIMFTLLLRPLNVNNTEVLKV